MKHTKEPEDRFVPCAGGCGITWNMTIAEGPYCRKCGADVETGEFPGSLPAAALAKVREALEVGIDTMLAGTSVACLIRSEGSEPCNDCSQCRRMAARRVMVKALSLLGGGEEKGNG